MTPRAITAAARVSLAIAVGGVLFLATTRQTLPDIAALSDKANHALAFLVLALLTDYSFPRARFGLAKAAALLAFGVAIEAIQYFLPWRQASVADLVADVAGIALYAVAAPFVTRLPLLRAGRP
jgi:VanZ family protein